MSPRSFSIKHYFLRRRVVTFFFDCLGGLLIGSFSADLVQDGALVFTLSEIILRSILEEEAVLLIRLGLLRVLDLDFESDLVNGLAILSDCFDLDLGREPWLLLVCCVWNLFWRASSSELYRRGGLFERSEQYCGLFFNLRGDPFLRNLMFFYEECPLFPNEDRLLQLGRCIIFSILVLTEF